MILRVLSALVSTCLPADGVCAVSPLVSHCLPMCVCGPVLEGVSAFPRPCLPLSLPAGLPLSPHVCAFVGWCPPSRGLVSLCFPWSYHMCWIVCPPSRGLVSFLSSLVALLGAKLQLLGLHIVPRATPKQHIISCRKVVQIERKKV